jgi:response regulator RpfG family c-di-GMP phosphodiesterase
MAGQAAIAIDNATLFDEVQQANINLRRAYELLLKVGHGRLNCGTAKRKGIQPGCGYGGETGWGFGIKDDAMVNVRRGALLHDIGKMGIPDHILLKRGL